MPPTHILVVDDEAGVRDVLKRYLEREGYQVLLAANGPDALNTIELERERLLLVVLDVMLPGIDGLEILKHVRGSNPIPIIILSARSEEFDRVAGLESGADDYVPKPFSPREVVSRVKAVLRRGTPDVLSANSRKPLMVGNISLDPDTRQVEVDGKACELTAKEFELLWLFMRHPRQVFTRDQLLDQVWGFSEFIDSSTVTVHIHRLRDKIEIDPTKPTRLITVWGVGYRLEPDR
ncbi:MAG: response regulator transcription factor [Chloroflexi bacterium]|nr:response regulator transcription factor [Chloroflexota bacterium]MCL5275821.1 response regulator transcription factor [Chloroflexota bacterium]